MSFRQHTTFNQHDTKMVSGDRLTIANGVEKRCNLILAYMKEEFYEWCGGEKVNPRSTPLDHASSCKLGSIVDHLQEIDSTYTRADVLYALRKLEDMGFISSSRMMGHGWYSLLHNPKSVRITLS